MGKLTGKVTQAVSKLYSDEKIKDLAANGTHRGESMAEIAKTIFESEKLEKRLRDNGKEDGVCDILYRDEKTGELKDGGWFDMNRGIGNIHQKAYDIAKEERLAKIAAQDRVAAQERELISVSEPDNADYGDYGDN